VSVQNVKKENEKGFTLSVTPVAMPVLERQNCCECGKSLVCEHCGNFMWNKLYIIDNAVSPWYFCSEECHDKFQEKLERKDRLGK